jgi:PAS domain S-box-containing protein
VLDEGSRGGELDLPADFLAAIIEAVAHPIFVKDRAFRFVLLNDALCRMVGRPREVMLGKTDYDFFPAAESDFFRRKDLEAFESGRALVIDEEPITDASGTRHILATTKVPLCNADGEATHLVGIIHDITRLKDVEEKLRRSNNELETRMQARTEELLEAQQRLLRQERLAVLGRLAGGLAHQIRNPLGAINNASFVLRRALRGHPDPDVRRSIEIILEEASQANRIVTDLVDFSRVRMPDRRRVAVAELISDLLESIELPSSVRTERSFPPLPEVTVDPRQIHDALRNLIQNALDAMPQGGTLKLGATLAGSSVRVYVEDTGPGVSPEVSERLFEPLVTTKPLGLGLGLSTARYLVETQGGELLHTGRPPPGARFELRLPVASAG